MARLPYDIDRPDSRYRRYSVRDWRNTPRVRVDRNLEEYLDDICVIAANVIGEKSDANELRTFYYNMMSRDEFRNRDFEDLIQFCVGSFELMMASSRNRNPEASLDKTIEAAVDLHTASMIDEYPELERELSETVSRAAAKNADLFKDMSEAIRDLAEEDRGRRDRDDRDRGRYRDRDRGRDRGRDRDDRGFVRRDLDRDRDDRRGGNGFARTERQRSHDRSGQPQYRGEYATSDSRDHDEREDNRRGDSYERRYDNDIGTRQEVGDRRDSVRDVMRSASTTMRSDDKNSKFTEEHFEVEDAKPATPAAWKPAYEHEEYGVNMGINGDESFMDYMAHAGAYPERGLPGVDLRAEMERFMTMVEANDIDVVGGTLKDLIDQAPEPDLNVDTNVDLIAATVVSDSIKIAEEKAKEKGTDERRSYRRPAIATNHFVGRPVLKGLQQIIGKASGLMDLHGKLRAASANVVANCLAESPDTTEVRAAMNFINAQLTDDINRYLTHVLRLAEPGHAYIDSFMDDFADLPAHIEKSAGARYADWFMAWCTNYARSFGEILDDTKLKLDETIRASSDMTDEMSFVAIPKSYMFTTIPFSADELGLKNRRPVLLKDSRAVLQILGRLSAEQLENMTTYSYANHIVVTRDLKLYEMVRDPSTPNGLVMSPL